MTEKILKDSTTGSVVNVIDYDHHSYYLAREI